MALEDSDQRQRGGHPSLARDFQRVAELLGRDSHFVQSFRRIDGSGIFERGRHTFRSLHQPRRQDAAPPRFELGVGPVLPAFLPFALFSLADTLELLEQLFQVSDGRVLRQLIAQRLPARRHVTAHHLYCATRHTVRAGFAFEHGELDVELADGAERARDRPHSLVELLDLRGRSRRADDRQRLTDAP